MSATSAPVTGIEQIATITITKGSKTVATSTAFNPATTSGTVLKKYSEIYDNYRIQSVSYRFVSDMSSTTSGNLSMGIDYNRTSAAPTTREAIVRLSPHITIPIKQSSSWLQVPPRMFDPKAIRVVGGTSTIDSPFMIALLATLSNNADTDTTIGALEIKYRLVFSGIRP